MAEELQNVSDVGVGVRVWGPIRPGDRLDITLWGPAAEWCGRGLGVVCWSVIGPPGHVLAGIRLSRRLTGEAVHALAMTEGGPLS